VLIKYRYRRVIRALLEQARVFETWFKPPNPDEWTLEKDKADWQRFHGLPDGAYMVDIKYEQYWCIDGKRYDNYNDAYFVMEFKTVLPYLMLWLLKWARKNKKAVA